MTVGKNNGNPKSKKAAPTRKLGIGPRFTRLVRPRLRPDLLLAIAAIDVALLATLAALPEPRPQVLIFGFVVAGVLLSAIAVQWIPVLQKSMIRRIASYTLLAFAFAAYGYSISRPVAPRFIIPNRALIQSRAGAPIRISINYLNQGDDADFFVVSSAGVFARQSIPGNDINAPDVQLESAERNEAKKKLFEYKVDDTNAISLRAGESSTVSLGPYSGDGDDLTAFHAANSFFYIAGYIIARSRTGIMASEEFCGVFQENGLVYSCPGKTP